MYDPRVRTPAELLEEETDELDEETSPAIELDPEDDQPLTDTAAGDTPEVEPEVGD